MRNRLCLLTACPLPCAVNSRGEVLARPEFFPTRTMPNMLSPAIVLVDPSLLVFIKPQILGPPECRVPVRCILQVKVNSASKVVDRNKCPEYSLIGEPPRVSIVVAALDGQLTVKKLDLSQDKCLLRPANSKYS